MSSSTITAISTPPGTGGIGIIKISGPRAVQIGLSLFKPKSRAASDSFPIPRHMYYGQIVHPETGGIIDEALFVYMEAPQTYTAEDVVEFQCHGGPLVLQTLLGQVLKSGARLAEPGEFTRRAFLNGRIDLCQAESVIDLINAKTMRSIEVGAAQMSGDLSAVVTRLRASLQEVLMRIEAAIDFPDDTEGIYNPDDLAHRLRLTVIPEIRRLIEAHETLHYLRDGVRVVIAGSPNVGKSSLMNRLVNRERAIVTDTPGTTRDFIEDAFSLRGVPIIVIDTAGIHEAPDPIERIGIDQTWRSLKSADLLLLVVDAGKVVTESEISLMERLPDKNRILVINKMDLLRDERSFILPPAWKEMPRVEISALFEIGMDELKDLMATVIAGASMEAGDRIVPNLRQKTALETCLQSTERVAEGFMDHAPAELISIDLRTALQALSEITGDSVPFDVLEAIFSQFCIGK